MNKINFAAVVKGFEKNKTLLLTVLFIQLLTLSLVADSLDNSLLWRVTGNGLEQPSYILGTHHLFSYNYLDEIYGVKEAFVRTEQMIGELDMTDMHALAFEMASAGRMPEGTTWQMLLSEDDYNFVNDKLRELLGQGLQTLGMFTPVMVSLQHLAVFYMTHFPDTNPTESMDIWFQIQATHRGIPIVGLETVKDQVNALNRSTLQQQADALLCALRNPDVKLEGLLTLNSLYRSANLNEMFALLSAEGCCGFETEQQYALNTERNNRWLLLLPELIKNKPSFIAVGALHLAGDVGLVVGLRNMGFTVEAVVQ